MLLWLSGSGSTRWAPNENYARELMELFTLGAGRGYTEDDVREQARALTGWRNDWKEGAGPVDFRFDRRGADRGREDRLRQARPRSTGRTRAGSACATRRTRPSSWRSSGRHFVPTEPDAATRTGLERLYRSNGFAVRPVVEAILRHPELYEGPRMVKPPAVVPRRHAARARPAGRHGELDVALRPRGPGALPPAQRVRLGRLPVARHVDLPRPLAGRRRGARAVRPRPGAGGEAARPEAARGRRDRLLGEPDRLAADPGGARRVRAHRARPTGARTGSARSTPSWWRTPSASSSPCPPTSRPHEPAALRRLRRPHAERPPAPGRRPRWPRPAGGRAGDAAARRHRPRPARVPRALGRARALGLRRDEARAAGPRRGDRARGLDPGRRRPGARLGLPRRRRRLTLDALPGRRRPLPQAPSARSRWRPTRARRSPRTTASAGTRRSTRSPASTGRGR